jgi:hypothetical protein
MDAASLLGFLAGFVQVLSERPLSWAVPLAMLLLGAALVVARRRDTSRRRVRGASESLLPISELEDASLGRQLRQFSVSSLFSSDGGPASTVQPCMPCTCDCGSPLCVPVPCSRAAVADASVQLAELEAALVADPRTVELLVMSARMPPSGLAYVSNGALFSRKLIGQCGSARASLELLDHALEFRKAHSIDQILRTPLPAEFLAQLRAVMPHGLHKTDNWGHPVYIERIGHIIPSEMASLWAAGEKALPQSVGPRGAGGGAHGGSAAARLLETRMNAVIFYHFQMVEYARIGYAGAHGGPGASKMVTVLDLSDLRLSLFASKACVERLGSLARLGDLLAVENLAAIWVVNAPWFFAKCWQAMSHLLVPRTAEKMRVLSPAETGPFLRQVMPAGNLPTWLGGECSCEGGCVSARTGMPSAAQREMDRNICAWAAEPEPAAATSALAAAARVVASDADAMWRPRRESVPQPLLPWLFGPLGVLSRCFAAPPASPAPHERGASSAELSPINARSKAAGAQAKRPLSATPSASATDDTERSHAPTRGTDTV